MGTTGIPLRLDAFGSRFSVRSYVRCSTNPSNEPARSRVVQHSCFFITGSYMVRRKVTQRRKEKRVPSPRPQGPYSLNSQLRAGRALGSN